MKRLYMIIAAVAVCASAFCQDIPFDKNYFQNQKDAFKQANSDLKAGESAFSKEFYYEALQYYLEAQKFNPNYSLLNYRIGVCYMALPMKFKSLDYFEKAYQLRRDVADDIHLMLARSYHLNGQYDKAIGEYKAHMAVLTPMEAPEMKPQLEKYIAECEYGKQLMDNPARAFIDNIGSVLNSRYNDHSPLISADESMMIFTSNRNNGRTESPEDGQYDEDIYISYNISKNWQVPDAIGEPINTQFDDATVGLTPMVSNCSFTTAVKVVATLKFARRRVLSGSIRRQCQNPSTPNTARHRQASRLTDAVFISSVTARVGMVARISMSAPAPLKTNGARL